MAADEESYTRLHDGRSGKVVRLVHDDISALPGVRLRIEEGGRLCVAQADRWVPTSLDGLSGQIKRAIEEDHDRQKAQGRSGFKERAGGAVSRLVVVLEAHPETPWLNIRWLMDLLAGVLIGTLELKVGDRALVMELPVDAAHPERSPKYQATVEVLARGGVSAKWGDHEVRRPNEIIFQVGGRGDFLDGLDEVKNYLREARDAAVAAGKGPLRASTLKIAYRTPTKVVIDVLAALDAAELGIVDLLSIGAPPSGEDRAATELRYPDPWG